MLKNTKSPTFPHAGCEKLDYSTVTSTRKDSLDRILVNFCRGRCLGTHGAVGAIFVFLSYRRGEPMASLLSKEPSRTGANLAFVLFSALNEYFPMPDDGYYFPFSWIKLQQLFPVETQADFCPNAQPSQHQSQLGVIRSH